MHRTNACAMTGPNECTAVRSFSGATDAAEIKKNRSDEKFVVLSPGKASSA